MASLQKERNLEAYYEKISIKPKNSRRGIERAINNFNKFTKEKFDRKEIDEVIDEIKILKDENVVFDTLQSWITWNHGSLGPRAIKGYFVAIKKYFHYRGIKLTNDDVKEELTFPTLEEEEAYPISTEDLRKILSVARHKKKTLYLAQSSSGMRIGELMQIRKKHLTLIKNRFMVKIPAKFTKKRRARTTFFSIEASQMILPYLKKMKDDDLVFTKNSNPDYATNIESVNLNNYCAKVGLDARYDNRVHKITTHSFRAFFITRMNRRDSDFRKMIVGHKGYDSRYDRLTDDEKLNLYLKFEPDLLVYDVTKSKAEIEQLKDEKSILLKKQEELEEMRETQDRILRKLEKYDKIIPLGKDDPTE